MECYFTSCRDTDKGIDPDWPRNWPQSPETLVCCSAGCWPVSRHEAIQQMWGARQADTDWHSAALQIRASKGGAWQDLHVPKDVRALVVLNFQSYSGGKDIWGLHDHRWPDEKAKGLKKPIFDDNCIEVSPRHSPSPHSHNLTVPALTIPIHYCGVPANSRAQASCGQVELLT